MRHYAGDFPEAIRLGHAQIRLKPDPAPAHVGLFMGGWFLATAIAEKLAHIFGGMWGNMTPTKYFMFFVIFCGVGGLLMALLIKPMKRMMHGVK